MSEASAPAQIDFLTSVVRRRTVIGERYARHAAHQSMTTYLDDWIRAYQILGRRITELEMLRDRRKEEAESGAWPPAVTAPSPEVAS